MIVVTTEEISGKNIAEMLGIAQGSVVMAKHLGSDFAAGLRNIVGGEVKGYTDMMNKSRREAFNRMVADAKEMGADAIIGMRYSSSTIMGGASEMLAYGTAVKIKSAK